MFHGATNDLLAAEAAPRQQRTRRDVAALDVVRSRARVWTGVGLSSALAPAPAPGAEGGRVSRHAYDGARHPIPAGRE